MKTILRWSEVRGSGFTLIELMVTCGVLLTLVSLAVVWAMSAKMSAHSAQCISNLRQQGVLLNHFVQNNTVYPLYMNVYFGDGQFAEHSTTWMSALDLQSAKKVKGNNASGIFDCPSSRRPDSFPKNMGFVDYGYNAKGVPGPFNEYNGIGGKGGQNWYPPPVQESEVVSPGNCAAIGDGIRGWKGDIIDGSFIIGAIPDTTTDSNESLKRANKRHKKKANVIYCDGHTESHFLFKLFSDSPSDLTRWNRNGSESMTALQQ